MLVVLDTNILVSAVLWSGRTTPILYLVKKGTIEFAINPSLIQELERVFGYPRFSKHLLAVGKSPREITEELIEMAIVVAPKHCLEHPQSFVLYLLALKSNGSKNPKKMKTATHESETSVGGETKPKGPRAR